MGDVARAWRSALGAVGVMFQPGDRVRWETTDDDGLPLVRYGFVGGCNGDHTRAVVMFDGDLTGDIVVDLNQLAPVTITNVELHLHGADLLDDPTLRQNLVNLWSAEAEDAGLEIRALHLLGSGVRETPGSDAYALAELWAGTEQYVLRASSDPAADTITIGAALPR